MAQLVVNGWFITDWLGGKDSAAVTLRAQTVTLRVLVTGANGKGRVTLYQKVGGGHVQIATLEGGRGVFDSQEQDTYSQTVSLDAGDYYIAVDGAVDVPSIFHASIQVTGILEYDPAASTVPATSGGVVPYGPPVPPSLGSTGTGSGTGPNTGGANPGGPATILPGHAGATVSAWWAGLSTTEKALVGGAGAIVVLGGVFLAMGGVRRPPDYYREE